VDDARITGSCIPQKDRIVREDRFGSLIFVDNDSDNLGSLVAGIIHHHGPGDERQELRDRASAMRSTWPRGARTSVLVNGATRPSEHGVPAFCRDELRDAGGHGWIDRTHLSSAGMFRPVSRQQVRAAGSLSIFARTVHGGRHRSGTIWVEMTTQLAPD
jgi:hypothetical protein